MRTAVERQSMEVLLVEDNPGDVRLLELQLEKMDDLHVDLRKAGTITEAEKILKESSVRAVLLDLSLPDSTGTESIKAMVSGAGERPVIVLTGLADHGAISRALEFGAQDYLLKDQLNPELLRKTLLYSVKYRTLLAHLIREQESLSRMHRLKDEFLSIVSHELRTPLTSILGYLKLMQKQCAETLKKEHQDYLATVMRNAELLLNLINTLLDLSRIERHAREPQPQMLRVVEEVVLAVKTAGMEYPRRKCGVAPGSEEEVRIWADSKMLQQVLVNLITNSLKYSELDRPVTIGWEATFRDDCKGTVIWVKDEGEGIPEEIRAKVFDKFFQAEKHMTRRKGGLGLGLSIVKDIAELHQGSVWVESVAGKGSTFFVFFPNPRPSVSADKTDNA